MSDLQELCDYIMSNKFDTDMEKLMKAQYCPRCGGNNVDWLRDNDIDNTVVRMCLDCNKVYSTTKPAVSSLTRLGADHATAPEK
jgi:RNase P subunit RPR2